MKWVLIFSALFVGVFSGCSESEYQSDEYKKFVKQYGASSRYYCNESGFLEEEMFIQESNSIPYRQLIENNAGIPIRCNVKDIQIRVKETVKTGSLSGGV